MIAHFLGGDNYLNIVPQLAKVNRGWSKEGRLFRSMEPYCAQHPGTCPEAPEPV